MSNPRLAILWRYLQTRSRRFPDRTSLTRFQEERVRTLLARILPVSAHTRQRFGNLDPSQWRNIPVMTKAEMMAGFDTLNTVGLKRDEALEVAWNAERSRDFAPVIGNITVGLSSGTTGTPGLFAVSPTERHRWAGTILAKALPRGILAPEHIALFLRANSNLYGTVRSNRIRFDYYDLQSPLESHLDRLQADPPTVIVAPPSMLCLLASAVVQGTLRHRLRKIISAAEVLDPIDESAIASAFAQPVHQIYQATEGFLGITCRFGTLHLNEDLVLFEKEFLDPSQTRFVPIITDLFRETQPMIRYRLEDVLVEHPDPCPCGSIFTALHRIEGRCDDLVLLPSPHGGPPRVVFPDTIRRALLECGFELRDYRVRQPSPGTLEIFLDPQSPDIQTRALTALDKVWEDTGVNPPAIRFLDEAPPLTPGRKLRRVERCFPAPD